MNRTVVELRPGFQIPHDPEMIDLVVEVPRVIGKLVHEVGNKYRQTPWTVAVSALVMAQKCYEVNMAMSVDGDLKRALIRRVIHDIFRLMTNANSEYLEQPSDADLVRMMEDLTGQECWLLDSDRVQ